MKIGKAHHKKIFLHMLAHLVSRKYLQFNKSITEKFCAKILLFPLGNYLEWDAIHKLDIHSL